MEWIVNMHTREVRPYDTGTALVSDEFIVEAPSAVDAASAGERRGLAEEAITFFGGRLKGVFSVVGDHIETTLDGQGAVEALAEFSDALVEDGFVVWAFDGTLLVLARRIQGTEGIHAWVSEIGSDR